MLRYKKQDDSDDDSIDLSMPSYDSIMDKAPESCSVKILSERAVEVYVKRAVAEAVRNKHEPRLVEITRAQRDCTTAWQAYIQSFVDYYTMHPRRSPDILGVPELVQKAEQLFNDYTGQHDVNAFESYLNTFFVNESVENTSLRSESTPINHTPQGVLFGHQQHQFFTPVSQKFSLNVRDAIDTYKL